MSPSTKPSVCISTNFPGLGRGRCAEALSRGKEAGEVRVDVNAADTAFFIVSALEGCIGMSKNTQSVAYRGCLAQLSRYLLDTLKR